MEEKKTESAAEQKKHSYDARLTPSLLTSCLRFTALCSADSAGCNGFSFFAAAFCPCFVCLFLNSTTHHRFHVFFSLSLSQANGVRRWEVPGMRESEATGSIQKSIVSV
jgi:hypothetical protein